MMLTQQETNKMKEMDDQHTQELREWRADVALRKQVSLHTHVPHKLNGGTQY